MSQPTLIQDETGEGAAREQKGSQSADWLLETGVTILCDRIEAMSAQFGFRGFGEVEVYSDPRAVLESTWHPGSDVFSLKLSDTLLRTVVEQQLRSVLVREMAFAAIGCHETLAGLDDDAAKASQSPFAFVREIQLRRAISKQREMRHALEFLADLKTVELGFEQGLIRFLETHPSPLRERIAYQVGWNVRVPDYKCRLERIYATLELRMTRDHKQAYSGSPQKTGI